MIQQESFLEVADNSGARRIQCIRVLGTGQQFVGGVGDVIVAAVKDSIPHAQIKKGDVVKAVIVRTKKEINRKDGSSSASIATRLSSSTTRTSRAERASSVRSRASCATSATCASCRSRRKIGRAHV